ncbi:hypothetical protein [Streptomyces sp. OE57]|uniref:hypothetical protein n=1 Tax=Streptomyces lacaronensis TaxID=3379885 RepID=UPI0039B77AE0
MPVIAIAGSSGSPGVTTTALALLLSWPLEPGRRVVLAECDPDGGSVLYGLLQGSLGDRYGLKNLSVAARKGEMTEAFWRQLVDMTEDGKAAQTAGERLLLPGITDPAQAAALAPAWEQLADLMAGIERHATYPHDVLIDLGRNGAFGPSGVLAQRADLLVMVARSTMRSIQSVQMRIEALQERVGEIGLLLVDQGPYSPGEVQRLLKTPVLATLPYRPSLARVLSDGAEQPSRFARSELMRAMQGATTPLRQRAALRRARLAPRGGPVPGGGEVRAGAW